MTVPILCVDQGLVQNFFKWANFQVDRVDQLFRESRYPGYLRNGGFFYNFDSDFEAFKANFGHQSSTKLKLLP